MKIVYHGETSTLHPELGELVPGVEREILDRDVPAAEAAMRAGAPIEIVGAEPPAVEEPVKKGKAPEAPSRRRRK